MSGDRNQLGRWFWKRLGEAEQKDGEEGVG